SLNQATTGACPSGASYWDIGVRGDTGPGDSSSGFSLHPVNSILTDFSGRYTGNGNLAPASPGVVSQYCNGSRVPPEPQSPPVAAGGYSVNPGISDATLPNPVFNLTPSGTVDEGNNWINMSYGPLSLFNLSSTTPSYVLLGNYSIQSGSAAVDRGDDEGAP